MKVLVATASKHGSTWEIGEAIARVLSQRGLDVSTARPHDVHDPGDFDAIILGSAIYAGHWRDEAKDLIDRHREALIRHDVWLFSSGPLGDPPKPEEEPVDATAIISKLNPRGHHVFAGKIDRASLSLAERAIVKAVRAPYGDHRDWEEVKAWAHGIADVLLAETAMNTHNLSSA